MSWTIETLKEFQELQIKHENELRLYDDRRYGEVALEREKALKIKETADLAALQLAREIQTYKDEKANELREQINKERGLYATKSELFSLGEKFEAAIKPIANFTATQAGRSGGLAQYAGWLMGALGLVIAAYALLK